MSRKTRKRYLRRSKRRSNGGGWSDGPDSVNPGNLVHVQYDGPGKDCAGVPVRPGYLNNTQGTGLPGLGKMFGGNRRQRKLNGGTSFGGNESIESPLTVSNSLINKPAYFPDTTGNGGTVANPVVRSTPGVSTELLKQAGGRYGFFPEMGPLNPSNGVGISPAPFGRIPCESGTVNPLNPNPNNVQSLSTAPSVPPYVVRGGAQFPEVQVGAADSMRYYAPTAGYSHKMEPFPGGSAVPGLMLNTPYDARAFNQACLKTGGGRRRVAKKKGGYLPVGMSAGTFNNVQMGEVMNRSDFDGSNKGLPVKFGGSRKRKTRRVTKRKKTNRRK